MNSIIKFMVAVIVIPAVLGLFYYTVMSRAVTHATDGLTTSMQRQSEQVAKRARERAVEPARTSPGPVRTQAQEEQDAARAELLAAQAEQEAAQRKEAAWQAFFKPKTVCSSPPDWDTQVECGNAHIRAKKEFEEKWARGELCRTGCAP